MKNKRITQFFLYQVRKRTTLIHIPVCQEIRSTGNIFLYSQENSLHNVFHIYKSKVLTPETHREINMLLNRFRHKEIICFTRSVNSRRTINDIRKTGNTLNIQFRFQFTEPISRIGRRSIIRLNRSIILLTYRTEYTQRADIYKLLRNHIQRFQRVYKIFSLEIIDIIKSLFVRAFGDTGTMNDIIKLVISTFMPGELGTKFIRMRKVQFQKMNLPVF